MTTISAKIITHSRTDHAPDLVTMLLRYPRPIHAEFMTHRAFSRNASSSRAMPVEKLIQQVVDDPFVPLHWGKNQPGMQAHAECDAAVPRWDRRTDLQTPYMLRDEAWLKAMENAVMAARSFAEAGYHKQIVNRLLEPFSHITVVVTATEWSNFFELRDHPDAEPHIQMLARAMKAALAESTPQRLVPGEWHLPFVRPGDAELAEKYLREKVYRRVSQREIKDALVKASVARCARTSYDNHDGSTPNIERDIELHDRLIVAIPRHASPAEHQGTPDGVGTWAGKQRYLHPHTHANFRGWQQYRHIEA